MRSRIKAQTVNQLQFRGLRVLASAIVLLGALTAPMSSIAARQAAEGSFRFAFWGDVAEQEAYQRVIDGFEARHPEIDVIADYTPGQSDFYRKIATDFAGGAPPDLFLSNYRQYGQYAAAGALEPVGPYLDGSAAIERGDYATVAMDAFRSQDGTQTCMPQNVSSLVVYYNVDLFAAAELPMPRQGWSWEEFIAAATALTQDTDQDGAIDQFGVVVEPTMYRMAPFIWSAGGELVDDIDRPTRLTLDTPEARSGIEAFVSLGTAGHAVVPGAAEAAAEDDTDRFMRGGAAMLLQSRREVPTLRKIDGFRWDVAPLPVLETPVTVLHSDAYCMAKDGKDRDAVWQFIEYAVGDEGQALLAETGRIVPSLDRVAKSAAFLRPSGAAGPLPPASSQIFIDNIAVTRRLPSISTWPEIEDAFNVEFERALFESIDLDRAIAAAIANTEDAFQRAAEDWTSG
jgi:multiple sugar transport system substrate-binding protein